MRLNRAGLVDRLTITSGKVQRLSLCPSIMLQRNDNRRKVLGLMSLVPDTLKKMQVAYARAGASGANFCRKGVGWLSVR